MKQTASIFLHYESSVSIIHLPEAKCEDRPIFKTLTKEQELIKEITQILVLVVCRGLTLPFVT